MTTLNKLIETGLALEENVRTRFPRLGKQYYSRDLRDVAELDNFTKINLRPILLALRLATEALDANGSFCEHLDEMSNELCECSTQMTINLNKTAHKIQALFPNQTEEKMG